MKKIKALIATLIAVVCCFAAAIAFSACGSGKSYTLSFDSIDELKSTYGAAPFTIQANGAGQGAGILPFDAWGSKKFKDNLGDVNGVGITYKISLDIADGDEGSTYTFVLTVHLIGNDQDASYFGEGDVIYTWTGSASEVDGGYSLAAADYCKFEVTGDIHGDGASAQTEFVPAAPYTCDSTQDVTDGAGRVVSVYLKYIFNGATVLVDGKTITEFTDVSEFADWDSIRELDTTSPF